MRQQDHWILKLLGNSTAYPSLESTIFSIVFFATAGPPLPCRLALGEVKVRHIAYNCVTGNSRNTGLRSSEVILSTEIGQ